MWHTLTCNTHSPVTHTHLWDTLTCDTHSPVTHTHLWHTLTCNTHSPVTHTHLWDTLTCDTHSPVTHTHLWHTLTCNTHSIKRDWEPNKHGCLSDNCDQLVWMSPDQRAAHQRSEVMQTGDRKRSGSRVTFNPLSVSNNSVCACVCVCVCVYVCVYLCVDPVWPPLSSSDVLCGD